MSGPPPGPLEEGRHVYVCHCNVVNDGAIRAAIAGGACDVDGVGARCGAGTRCGGCVPAIEDLLAEAAAAIAAPTLIGARQAARRRDRRTDQPLVAAS